MAPLTAARAYNGLTMTTVTDDIRDRLDIAEVVGGYVQLKKAGRSYKGLCPFHAEKTPSFTVDPARGTWHCFGACSTGGDVFSFVMRAENTDFRGALEILARRAGVALEAPTPQGEARERHKARLQDALAAAAAFYHRQLMRAPEAEVARDYLKGRAFTGEVARSFELGWAPAGWEALTTALRHEGFGEEDLVAAGLARARDTGGLYDYFRGRLMIPIRDPRGRAIGFGARTLEPDGQPKYLNSPQTELFDKSRVLFALDKAGPSIRAEGEAVVVEGYTDVIRAHAANCANVVASLGTALTAHHVQALKRRAKRIILALDADAAGQAATLRGLAMAQEALVGESVRPVPTAEGLVRYVHQLDVDLRVATLPEGQDPDDVLAADPDLWRTLIRAAQPVMAFLIDAVARGADLESPRGKSEAVEQLLPFLAEIPDPVQRAAWVAEVSQRVRVSERSIENRLAAPKPVRRAPRQALEPQPEEAPPPFLDDGASDAPPWALDQPQAPTKPRPAPRPPTPALQFGQGGSDLGGYILGHLLAAPRRLKDVNARLRSDAQPALGPEDFDGALERDLLVAVRHAMLGVPPPDAPDEHRLEALPEAHAVLAAALRARAAAEPPTTEAARVESLRTATLRLREQARRRSLEGLRFLQAEAGADEKGAFGARVAELAVELAGLQKLLSRDITR